MQRLAARRNAFHVTVVFAASLWLATSGAADFVPGEPPITEGAFTIVVLPDTQNYSERHPKTFDAQTRWIADNKAKRNIACVLHLGDITNNNTKAEWENARRSMGILDGVVPFFMAVGNHDYGPGGNCTTRDTFFNEYFPIAKISSSPNFGGVYDKEPDRLDNAFFLFEAGGRKWLVLSLEFGPRTDVVRWSNDIIARHPDRTAILITHAFIFNDGTRYDWKSKGKKQAWNPYDYGVSRLPGGVSDGEDLWQNLVSKHPQFVLVINGHVLGDGLGKLVSKGAADRPVHQMLVNFQMKPHGGDGWLRILEFLPDGKTVKAFDYSPTLGQRNTSPENEFTIEISGPPGR